MLLIRWNRHLHKCSIFSYLVASLGHTCQGIMYISHNANPSCITVPYPVKEKNPTKYKKKVYKKSMSDFEVFPTNKLKSLKVSKS